MTAKILENSDLRNKFLESKKIQLNRRETKKKHHITCLKKMTFSKG